MKLFTKILLASSFIVLLFVSSFAKPAFAQVSGAVFTTDISCGNTNVNIYSDKNTVYLNGGPQHGSSAGLPDGSYYVQVTDPSGAVVLGKSVTPNVTVTGGSFAHCYQLATILFTASSSFIAAGYDDTTNAGGEYKVWVSQDPTFVNNTTKTDNFKVKSNPQNDLGSISGVKWQDNNADGVQDGTEPLLPNWGIELWDATQTNKIASTTTDSQGFYEFNDVIPGTYQVCEVIPDNTWYPSYPTTSTPNCHTAVVVTANTSTNNVNFGNYQYASLTVIKHVINDNGGTNVAGDFTMNVTGTNVSNRSFPGAEDPGVTVTLKPGTYAATESGLFGYAESDSQDCAGTATSGQTLTCTITNNDIAPQLTVIKHVIKNSVGTKSASDFTMYVTGTNVSNPSFPGSESGVTVTLNAGAYNATESSALNYTGVYSADCTGTINIGQTKTCTITNIYQPATRTLGFWQTHTAFTHQIYLLLASFSQNYVGVNSTPTSSSHKGIITDIQATSQSQLLGAFYASISKKITGQARTTLDQDRMILLQQLVAAKLNCAMFTCIPSTVNVISQADADYAAGNIAAILNDANALDTYNNSNDNAPLGSYNPGSATSQLSSSYANKAFWNQP